MLQGLVSPARGKLSLLYFKLSQASNGCKKRFLQGGRPPIDRQDDDALTGTSGVFLEEMEALWNRHREAVGPAWQEFFSKYSKDNLVGSNLNSKGLKTSSTTTDKNSDNSIHGTHVSECADHVIEDYMKVQLLIRAYQVRGHLKAQIDPLGIMQPNRDFSPAPELELEYYGFGPSDLNRSFKLGPGVLPAFQKKNFQGSTTMTLLQIYQALHRIYCGTIGYEYTHIPDRDKCDWLRARIEVPRAYNFDIHKKKIILDRLTWADGLERFLATKFPGEKRFGLEGGESLVPGMKALIDRSVLSSSELSQLENLLHPEFNHHDKNIKSSRGVDHIVIGMAHRGRLNVLANVVRKPLPSILCEFAGRSANETANNHSGDVKYHLGMTYTRPTPSGRPVCISLVANPSHLEAASPVVLGKVRALQFYAGDTPPFSLGSPTKMRYDSVESHNCAMAILIHGDAAFAGQGVVCEALGLSALPHYSTGGTIHIIVNNQIGFTTDPRFARSSPYCSDLAKTIAAPILHVNGSDVEAVVHACELAADWRRVFKTDVVIDLVCFRRFGHNEVDQPAFTQPRMCAAIARQPSCLEQYVKNICDSPSESKNDTEALGSSKSAVNKQPSGSSIYLNEDLDFQSPENNDSKNSEFSKISVQSETKILHKEFLKIQQKVKNFMEEAYALSKTYQPTNQDWLASSWPGFRSPKELLEDTPCLPPDTGLDIAKLKQIGTRAASFPPTFAAHPGVARIMSARRRILETGEGIDMATAESLAFGTLLAQGSHVRLSGQDVERGTFSQRHAVLHQQAPFEHSSHLSNAEANVQNNIKILNKNLDRTDENVDKNATVMVENRQQTSPNVERQYIPLQNVSEGQARFVVCNSSLSEFGVLGFELGYSLVDPKALILWEAQFGDFCNGAQVIIDQFLASGERKWLQRTGLVMLLPHGYDGAGPEHSNARIDRFLSLCDDNPYSYPSIEKLSGVKGKL